MSWRDTWDHFKVRFKASRSLSERVKDGMEEEREPEKTAESEKTPEKLLEPLVWTKRIGGWEELAVCVHCDHITSDLQMDRVCPKCGCKGSHEIKVVRWEWEEVTCALGHPEFDYGKANYFGMWTGTMIRNKKLVTWTGCSAKEEKEP